ncbi:MAG: AAA domain-containing protein [Sphingobacteriaceae bacterium]
MDYFDKLRQLLKIAFEEDLHAYRGLTETTSIADRRNSGLVWYPIAICGTEISRGDYITIEAERTTHVDLPHKLRFGASAALFSNHDARQERVEGTIAFVMGNRIKVTLRTDDLPDWAHNGKLGIELLFDNNSYAEMGTALKQADALVQKEVGGHLVAVLTGKEVPAFAEVIPCNLPASLNPAQQLAVHKILSAQDLMIIHGPPGTGKTTTLIQGIYALLKQDSRQILVVAPSNTAVDLLSEKLADTGLNVLRIGNPARVSEKLLSLTLDSKMNSHTEMKEIRKLKKQAAALKNMAHKYKRNFGTSDREQRKALFSEAHKIIKEVETAEQYIMDSLISKAQIITATLVGACHYSVRDLRYHTVVIDEAGQALEPACWIPILKAKKLIMAGDHCQLAPTIKSAEAAKGGLDTTLFEKCISLHPEAVVLLETQYRMHEDIMGYSSVVFYQNKLKAHESVAQRLLFLGDRPLNFIDTAGCGFNEKREGTSTSNPEEAVFLLKHLTLLISEIKENPRMEILPSIAIISPYKQQIQLLKSLLESAPDLIAHLPMISVNTIDGFQGQERDVIYISLTRSNPEGTIGFLSEIRRMNVAMTRAKKKLVVIGDSTTLSRFPFYANFIAYAEERNAYQSAWEFMDG